MNSSKIYSLALSGFVKHLSSGEQIFNSSILYIYIYIHTIKKWDNPTEKYL